MTRKTFGFLALCLAVRLIEGGPVMAEDSKKPSISVAGEGRVTAAPDVAEIHVGVVTQASTARDALAANNEAMNRLMEVVKERGVATKDVQTSNINVSPQYSQPPQPRPGREDQAEGFVPRIVAYNVTNTVQITARKLDKLGELLDAVVQAGANQMHGISFRVDEPEKLLDQARKSAMADAKRKAEILVGEAGVVLGSPIQISESSGPIPFQQQKMMFGRAMAAAEAMPVAPGEEELKVSVSVTYELRAAR
jgi:uncharacterized protein YggE